jgi:Icc-related predicted phosphoesterase
MKIQLVSDLHLEFADINIQNLNGADVLILSGDICVAQDLHDHIAADFNPYSQGAFADLNRKQQRVQRFRDFFKRVSFQFTNVIYVMGNHEHYHGKFDRSRQYFLDEFAKLGITNIHLLDNDTKEIDGVHFVGGTLWTDMNKGDPMTVHAIETMMNDFRVIRIANEDFRKFLPSRAIREHIKTKQYIKTVLEGLPEDARVVVVGHHAPSTMSIHEQYKHDTLMNGGYASDLSEFILDRPKIKAWTHGHMHQCFDYMIGDTRVLCNPRGYHDENPQFNPNFIFEV